MKNFKKFKKIKIELKHKINYQLCTPIFYLSLGAQWIIVSTLKIISAASVALIIAYSLTFKLS